MRSRYLGPTLDRRAHYYHYQLGDGVQALVPGAKNSDLLWIAKGEKVQAPGME